ncbi:DNA-3-methyladenine glycosylase isoform X2 [Andrographis paniculata]|uniref:DNA-3-methyladenine glycosylase isoform X2 n=1 Tax=Andrographis paniculata TaxID=175694 RepID=UPI0021E90B33|nr:DNA-3-methyladenine glycosylase isoform X2 [Andrographis paniculata]
MNKQRQKVQKRKRIVKITYPTTAVEKSSPSATSVKPKAESHPHCQEHDGAQPVTSICSISLGRYSILNPDFYQVDALDLGPRLLGKHLKKDDVVLQITEVEAYRQNDSACHARFGITARTAPVFGAGGHAYVYLCYGLHNMLNVVADKEGRRRGSMSDKPVLLSGPGKVGQALGLTTEWSNHPLFIPGGLELLDGEEPEDILVGPRVGIAYALPEHVNAPWRFAVAGTPWISAPRNTLRPLIRKTTHQERGGGGGGEGKSTWAVDCS